MRRSALGQTEKSRRFLGEERRRFFLRSHAPCATSDSRDEAAAARLAQATRQHSALARASPAQGCLWLRRSNVSRRYRPNPGRRTRETGWPSSITMAAARALNSSVKRRRIRLDMMGTCLVNLMVLVRCQSNPASSHPSPQSKRETRKTRQLGGLFSSTRHQKTYPTKPDCSATRTPTNPLNHFGVR